MGETQKKEKKKIGLTTKIFIALLAGAIFGIILLCCIIVNIVYNYNIIFVYITVFSIFLCQE